MKCPHCNKPFEPPTAAYTNAECYGGGRFHVSCKRCKKAVEIRASRKVVVEVIGKGKEDEVEPWV